MLVHSGRDLPKMDRFGKSDPYCVVEADGQKQKTKVPRLGFRVGEGLVSGV